jgi:hypothetical protein
VCAVASDQKPRAKLFTPTIVALEYTPEAVILAFKRNQLVAAFDQHTRRTEVIVQYCLSLRLRYEQDERKTGVHGTNVTEGDCRDCSAFEVQLQAGARIASSDEQFPEAEHLQQLECARLDGERTGFTCAIE